MMRNLRSEAGETLVELLMTIVVMMLGATAVLGALASSIGASGEHRSIAAIDMLLKSHAENAKYQIELKQPGPLYANCATPSTYSNTNLTWTYPARYSTGYSVSVTAVEAWDVTTGAFDTLNSGSCVSGLQRLTIASVGPTSVSDSMQIVVRDPAYNSAFGQVNAGF